MIIIPSKKSVIVIIVTVLGVMSVASYLLLFLFYVIHDDQMLIDILKKSTLALQKDATIILLYQFLGKLKTVCFYPYFARQNLRESKLGVQTTLSLNSRSFGAQTRKAVNI